MSTLQNLHDLGSAIIGRLFKTKGFPRKGDIPSEAGSTIPRPVSARSRRPVEDRQPSETSLKDTRAASRFVPRRQKTFLTTDTGKKLDAHIINLSSHGVAVEALFSEVKPSAVVMIGAQRVKQGRRIALGAVFVFEKPIEPARCNPDIVL